MPTQTIDSGPCLAHIFAPFALSVLNPGTCEESQQDSPKVKRSTGSTTPCQLLSSRYLGKFRHLFVNCHCILEIYLYYIFLLPTVNARGIASYESTRTGSVKF